MSRAEFRPSVTTVIKERLDAAIGDDGEKITVEWRGTLRPIPVITMPVGLLTLNPDTHRVKAQRSLYPDKDVLVAADPRGSAAQAYLADLLRGDPKDPERTDPEYIALREDLAAHGQTDPGVITRDGVLINGNTRCVALRELGKQDIRVGVLPADAGHEDFARVELSMQLRREYKRQYSFVNFLLAIDEQLAMGKDSAAIQRDFRIKAQTFDRARWILEFIRDAIQKSKWVDEAGTQYSLRYIDFEDHQGKLEELWRAYTSASAASPSDGDLVRDLRLVGLALGGSKTDLRNIEPEFLRSYLQPRLPADLLSPTADTTAVATIPGLDVAIEVANPEVIQASRLAERVLRDWAAKTKQSGLVGDPNVDALNEAFWVALQSAGRHQSLRRRRLKATDRLGDVNDGLSLCLDAIRDAKATGTFRPEDLDDGLQRLSHHLKTMWQLIERDGGQGDGLAWLATTGRS